MSFFLRLDLTFLGCIFHYPSFNESGSIFPESAVRNLIPYNRKEGRDIQFCKQNAKKYGDLVFGIYRQYCLHASKLHLLLPPLSELKRGIECSKDHIRIYSLAGKKMIEKFVVITKLMFTNTQVIFYEIDKYLVS